MAKAESSVAEQIEALEDLKKQIGDTFSSDEVARFSETMEQLEDLEGGIGESDTPVYQKTKTP
ncbi:MAG TPA: hypothetical protein VFI61_04380 [Patescibacteria group bacterium]|nr:hypothetical protein [Patescibacteria group bacterium]